MTLHYITTR